MPSNSNSNSPPLVSSELDLTVSGFQLTATGLVPVGEPTYAEWEQCGEFIKRAEKAVGFWIGDWLNYGKAHWGEMYAQAIEETSLSYQTLANYKYVASKVDFSRRRERLSFMHHSEVSSLAGWEQDAMLGAAVTNGWDSKSMRDKVKAYKIKKHHASLPPFNGKLESLADRLTILHGNACELSGMVDKAHLVFTSPPYNVGIAYEEHDDALDVDDYADLLANVFAECYAALVVGGRMGVVFPFGVGRNPYVSLVSLMERLLIGAGFDLRGHIVWDKSTTGNRTSWGSWLSPSNPSLRDRTECILVAQKESADLEIKGAALVTGSDEFMALTQNAWHVPPESAQRVKHPAPFPLELAERFIKLYGYAGCKVVDPFMGSGSTLIAALRLGCEAVGVDIDATYCALARERIKEELAHEI